MVVIVKPSLKEADRKKLIDSVKEWMKGMKIKKQDDWGQKPLAYKIKKEDAGFYYLWQLETEESVPLDLEQKILRNENIIRHLMLRTK